jgi:hypothetical protein
MNLVHAVDFKGWGAVRKAWNGSAEWEAELQIEECKMQIAE